MRLIYTNKEFSDYSKEHNISDTLKLLLIGEPEYLKFRDIYNSIINDERLEEKFNQLKSDKPDLLDFVKTLTK